MYPFAFDYTFLLNESGRCRTADVVQGSGIDGLGRDEGAPPRRGLGQVAASVCLCVC